MGVNFNTIKNSADLNRNLYSTFSQQLITDGTIQWRTHSDHQDTVIMSDYNPSTGNLSPLSYVHVNCTESQTNGQGVILKCTCHIYNTIQCAGLSSIDLSHGEDAALDDSMTCMHCRFFKECLLKYRTKIPDITSSLIVDTKVKNSLHLLNNPVVVVGTASQNSTTKLSVLHQSTPAMVHIYFNQSNSCFAKCQNGECAARLQNKKKILKTTSIHQSQHLCGHIQTLFANFEIVSELFPTYFNESETNCEGSENVCFTSHDTTNSINAEDQAVYRISHQATHNFDVNTGLWMFDSRSDHKPNEMTDLHLTRYYLNFHINDLLIKIFKKFIIYF